MPGTTGVVVSYCEIDPVRIPPKAVDQARQSAAAEWTVKFMLEAVTKAPPTVKVALRLLHENGDRITLRIADQASPPTGDTLVVEVVIPVPTTTPPGKYAVEVAIVLDSSGTASPGPNKVAQSEYKISVGV